MSGKIKIYVYNETQMNQGTLIEIKKGQNLLEGLRQAGIAQATYCGGVGLCGKCKICLLDGKLEISMEDRKFFSSAELKKGYRLACKAVPVDECKVLLLQEQEQEFSIISHYEKKSEKNEFEYDNEYVIGIDIGTTTLVFQLVGKNTKKVLHTHTAMNHQRDFGADVISRIKASNEGKKEQLCKIIRSDLRKGIQELLSNKEFKKENVKSIAVGANTTMVHLLMNYSCESLGEYPFTPVNISTIRTDCRALLGMEDIKAEIIILPGISTFIGGDIISGLYKYNFYKMDETSVFIDLGTNGEIVVGNKNRILCTSTAAGPAFEGGYISCGVGSIQGAICNVDITKEGLDIRTIGNKPAVGICGTGVVEIVSELVRAGLVDETGLLESTYFKEGYPLGSDRQRRKLNFTQKDIRELQLAKAAVRAGIEILLKRFGVTYEQIDKIYLAGGFGYKIDIKKAILIGLLPAEFCGRIQAVGNSSLAGAVEYLFDEEAGLKIDKMIDVAEEISLSKDDDFNEYYMQYMMFETCCRKVKENTDFL
ncbi:ASKHA domain-containing protein [Anaerosacchariphilus polymeriproducens]|nr:ASKHA domain-containing protein [Anaerosacchariphilus polymeriproducens]